MKRPVIRWTVIGVLDILLPILVLATIGYGVWTTKHLNPALAIGAIWIFFAIATPFAEAYGHNWLFRGHDEAPRKPTFKSSFQHYTPWILGLVVLVITLYTARIPW